MSDEINTRVVLGSLIDPVRLSYPKIWHARSFDGGPARFEASFLLDPSNKAHAATLADLKEKAEALAKATFGGKIKGVKYCFQDGNTKDYEGYENMMFVATSESSRPTIVDQHKNPLAEEDGKPYAGCYVVGLISLWASDHPKGGKRISANLRAVQFVKDGEPFSGRTSVDIDSEFDAVEDLAVAGLVDDLDDLLG